MESQLRAQVALFGVKDGHVWVADDVFVARTVGGALVERWVGSRIVTVLTRRDGTKIMRIVWAKLNAIAVDTGGSFHTHSAIP